MAAEDAAVVVGLVDHQVTQPAQEAGPAAVVGQDAEVEHVGVGQDGQAFFSGLLAARRRGVAVVSKDPVRQLEGVGLGFQPAPLVAGQGFCRVDEEGGGAFLHGGDYRGLKYQALTRGGRGGHDDVKPFLQQFEGGNLMAVRGNAPPDQGGFEGAFVSDRLWRNRG